MPGGFGCWLAPALLPTRHTHHPQRRSGRDVVDLPIDREVFTRVELLTLDGVECSAKQKVATLLGLLVRIRTVTELGVVTTVTAIFRDETLRSAPSVPDVALLRTPLHATEAREAPRIPWVGFDDEFIAPHVHESFLHFLLSLVDGLLHALSPDSAGNLECFRDLPHCLRYKPQSQRASIRTRRLKDTKYDQNTCQQAWFNRLALIIQLIFIL